MKVKTIVLGLVAILCIVIFFLIMILLWFPKIRTSYFTATVEGDLKQLHMLLMMYSQDYDSYPKVTPEGGNGVRDFYPLYATGLLEKRNLKLLQPPGTKLKRFSDNPTIDEFDKYHIGFSYNSTTPYDETNTIPLLADQGVSSGSLQLETNDNGLKARGKNGAVVLFDSGRIEFIPADKNGRLSTNKLSQAGWSLLKD